MFKTLYIRGVSSLQWQSPRPTRKAFLHNFCIENPHPEAYPQVRGLSEGVILDSPTRLICWGLSWVI